MNGYVAFYKGKRIEVEACSAYRAQLIAAKIFKVKPNKAYQVTVVLAEVGGKQVVHVADF